MFEPTFKTIQNCDNCPADIEICLAQGACQLISDPARPQWVEINNNLREVSDMFSRVRLELQRAQEHAASATQRLDDLERFVFVGTTDGLEKAVDAIETDQTPLSAPDVPAFLKPQSS